MNHPMRQSERIEDQEMVLKPWSKEQKPHSLECWKQVDGGAVLIRAWCLSAPPEPLHCVMITDTCRT